MSLVFWPLVSVSHRICSSLHVKVRFSSLAKMKVQSRFPMRPSPVFKSLKSTGRFHVFELLNCVFQVRHFPLEAPGFEDESHVNDRSSKTRTVAFLHELRRANRRVFRILCPCLSSLVFSPTATVSHRGMMVSKHLIRFCPENDLWNLCHVFLPDRRGIHFRIACALKQHVCLG